MKVEPAGALVGHIAVPGDKSISHRAVLIGALCDGETRVRGFGRSGDTQSTIDAVRTLGVEVDDHADDELLVHAGELTPALVDCGNAGTLMRLLAGILAGKPGRWELTGDESLRARPMDRIAEPLNRMGDLIVTCFSGYGRNRRAGELIARGATADEAIAEIGQVVEGLTTAPVLRDLSHRLGVELPITEGVCRILGGESLDGLLASLMGRVPTAE